MISALEKKGGYADGIIKRRAQIVAELLADGDIPYWNMALDISEGLYFSGLERLIEAVRILEQRLRDGCDLENIPIVDAAEIRGIIRDKFPKRRRGMVLSQD